MPRRKLLVGLGSVLAGMGLVAACAPIGAPPSNQAPAPTGGATLAPAQARRGGTLVYGALVGPKNTLPYPNSPANSSFRNAMFSTLVRLDPRAQPLPDLAESWAVSDDRQTVIFKFRHGVTFHSGRPFTAAEAKWSIEYAQDPKALAQTGSELKGVETRVIDANTLELKLPDVLPHIFSLLADVQVIDPQADLTINAAGTGPFKLDGFTPDDEMRLVRFNQYWRSDRPFLDAVTIKTVPDKSGGLAALESGALGLTQCPESDVHRLSGGGQTRVAILPTNGNWELLINVVHPPLSDQRVRQAINLSLDRKRFTETLLYGLSEPTYIVWPRRSPAWDAALDVGQFNLDKARQLLVEAGYPNGFETRIQGSTNYPALNQFLQIVQSDLAKIGVNASLEVLESSQATAIALQGKFSDMFALQYGNADQDPAQLFTAPPFRQVGNVSHFESDQYRQLVEAARREPDVDKRMGLYRQIATFLKDAAFVLPIASRVTPWALRLNVHGVSSRAPSSETPLLEDIWVE